MIVAFSGKRGVGKTLAATYLEKCYGFVCVSFADALKQSCKDDFGFSDAQLYGHLKEQKFPGYDWTPREYMIRKGQMLRYFEPNYWLNKWEKRVNELPLETNVVVDDCRYSNEAEYVKRNCGKIIRLERYKAHNPYFSELFVDDPSETQLDDYAGFDFKIEKFYNKDQASLHKKLDYLMDTWGIGYVR